MRRGHLPAIVGGRPTASGVEQLGKATPACRNEIEHAGVLMRRNAYYPWRHYGVQARVSCKSPQQGDSRGCRSYKATHYGTGLPWLVFSEVIRFLFEKKGGTMINQEGTTLFEYLIAVIIIIAVGIALVHPGISSWCLIPY